jgi:RNA polymerase sporulation-specific sigma factor
MLKSTEREYRLDSEQLIELIERARNGDRDAEERIIQANLGLIHMIASRCKRWANKHYVRYDDIWQQGVLGLYPAIHKFDHLQGEFSTYAYNWIYYSIVDYVFHNMWCIDSDSHRKGARILRQIKAEFASTYKRAPTQAEISEISHFSARQVVNYDAPSIRILRFDQAPCDPLDQTAEEELEELELLSALHEGLAKLREEDSTEVKIVEMYYGLTKNSEPMTRTAIARALRVEPYRVHRVLRRFTDSLREAMHVQSFFDFDPRHPYSEAYAELKYYR